MIRAMEKRRPTRRVPRTVACPKCGKLCICRSTRRVTNCDGTEIRIRYRYCSDETCDGRKKEIDQLFFD